MDKLVIDFDYLKVYLECGFGLGFSFYIYW